MHQGEGTTDGKEQLLPNWHLEEHSSHETNVPDLALAKGPCLLRLKVTRFHVGHMPNGRGNNGDWNKRIKKDDILVCEASDGVKLVHKEDAEHEGCTCDVLVIVQHRFLLEHGHQNPGEHQDQVGEDALHFQLELIPVDVVYGPLRMQA